MRIYLAGKMTGEPEHGFPAFNQRTSELRAMGHEVFNPAENGGGGHYGRDYYMRMDIFAIIGAHFHWDKVDAVAVLPRWELSRGARLEVEIALQLSVAVIDALTLEPLSQEELDRVAAIECPSYFQIENTGVAA